MKSALVLLSVVAFSVGGVSIATSGPAQAVVYCQYINYPAKCVARPGVVLKPRPAARAVTPGVGAPGAGVRRGTPANRGGPVNRAGRR
jgi:hypothetical protein